MDESRRRQIRGAHANHAFHCTCGKIVWGNGGKASHAYMHERKGDDHYFTSPKRFYELFPNAPGAPLLEGETLDEYQARIEK